MAVPDFYRNPIPKPRGYRLICARQSLYFALVEFKLLLSVHFKVSYKHLHPFPIAYTIIGSCTGAVL